MLFQDSTESASVRKLLPFYNGAGSNKCIWHKIEYRLLNSLDTLEDTYVKISQHSSADKQIFSTENPHEYQESRYLGHFED
jgi:hypothetical protein